MEGKRHQQMRTNLVKALANSGFEVKTSHEKGHGKINLYHKEKGLEKWLSDVDLVLLKDGEIRNLIEIKDRDITPKVILGTIEATDLATKCVVGKEEKDVKNAMLFIVVNSQALQGSKRRKSCKPAQLELIEELMRKRLGRGSLIGLKIFHEFNQDEKNFEELMKVLTQGKK